LSTRHDYNDQLGEGDAFTKKNPNWKTQPVLDEWEDYAKAELSEPIMFSVITADQTALII